jgi:hypothetical protein
MTGRVGKPTGLSQAESSSTVSALTGFDPSRKDDAWNVQRDLERRTTAMRDGVRAAKALHWLQSYGLNPFHGSSYGEFFGGFEEAKPYIAAATEAFAKQLSQRAIDLISAAQADRVLAIAAHNTEAAIVLKRYRATIERIRAALEFVEPRDRDELDSALAADIAAGMSLRRAAAKHGTTLSIARRAVDRAALKAGA